MLSAYNVVLAMRDVYKSVSVIEIQLKLFEISKPTHSENIQSHKTKLSRIKKSHNLNIFVNTINFV